MSVKKFSESISSLDIPSIDEGDPVGILALVKVRDKQGGIGWAVRSSSNLNDEETLGVLTGYVKFLQNDAANSWED